MNGRIRNLVVTLTICSFAMLAGCTTTTSTLDVASVDTAAVFGSFDLVKNGEAVELGDGIFDNQVSVAISRQGTDEAFVGNVGSGGEFTWYLEPGEYHVSSFSFGNRGERFEPQVSLNFTVAGDADAVYIGAMKVYVTSFSGYHGTDARMGGPEIRNGCRWDCAARLEQLQLDKERLMISILHPPGRMVGNY